MLKSPRFSKESATNLWLQDPDLAIAARQEKRLIAEECKKRKVSLTEWRSGSRRGEIPAVRPEVSRKLVEGYGITIAELARQVSASTSVILKNLARSYSSSQQHPYFPLVNQRQRWPCGFLVSIDLINSFVVGISGGEILSGVRALP